MIAGSTFEDGMNFPIRSMETVRQDKIFFRQITIDPLVIWNSWSLDNEETKSQAEDLHNK